MESTLGTTSVQNAALTRRSIRKYTDEAISEAQLNEILAVAGRAPSAWNIQPWRVVAVRDEALKTELMAASYGQPQVGNNAALLVVYSDMKDALGSPLEFIAPTMPEEKKAEQVKTLENTFGPMGEDGAETWGNAQSYIFVGYLLLSLEAAGWSSSPMLGFEPDKIKAILGLPGNVRIPALVAVGRKAEDGFLSTRHSTDRFVSHR